MYYVKVMQELYIYKEHYYFIIESTGFLKFFCAVGNYLLLEPSFIALYLSLFRGTHMSDIRYVIL